MVEVSGEADNRAGIKKPAFFYNDQASQGNNNAFDGILLSLLHFFIAMKSRPVFLKKNCMAG